MHSHFTIKRRGEFRIRVHGPNHCGTVAEGEELAMKYKLTVVCEEESLDDRGFLFDQMGVQRYFEERHGMTSLSCEKFARDASKHLLAHIRKENPECRIAGYALALSPAPYVAELTYSWERERISEPAREAARQSAQGG